MPRGSTKFWAAGSVTGWVSGVGSEAVGDDGSDAGGEALDVVGGGGEAGHPANARRRAVPLPEERPGLQRLDGGTRHLWEDAVDRWRHGDGDARAWEH